MTPLQQQIAELLKAITDLVKVATEKLKELK